MKIALKRWNRSESMSETVTVLPKESLSELVIACLRNKGKEAVALVAV